MKIAVIINPLPKTNLSPAKSVGKLLSILPSESDIYFFGIGYNDDLLPSLNTKFHPIFLNRQKNVVDYLKKQKNINKKLREIKPDVVLFWIADKMFKVMNFCKKQNIPTVMWVYGNTFPFIESRIKRAISKTIFIKMLRDTKYIAEEHSGVMELWKKENKDNRFSQKCLFHNLSIFCDYPIFNGSKKNSTRYVVVSRIAKEKNIDLILEAFLSLYKEKNDYSIEIIGSGPLEDFLKIKYSKFKNIIFSGWQNKNYLVNAMNTCSYFISASSSEGFPSSIQEAVKSKNIIIAYPVGGLTSFLTNNNSIIIEKLEIGAIQKALQKADSLSANEKSFMIQNALNDLEKDFSFDSCKSKMRAALEYINKNGKQNGKRNS